MPSGWPSRCAVLSSVSVSELEETSSSSHESTTSFFFDLDLEVFLESDVCRDSFETLEVRSAEADVEVMTKDGCVNSRW